MDKTQLDRVLLWVAVGWLLCALLVFILSSITQKPEWEDKDRLIVTHDEQFYKLVPMKLVEEK